MSEAEQYKLSEEENKRIFLKRIAPQLLACRESQDTPTAVFLISQPGSGKSRLQQRIDPALNERGGYVDLDTDLYKPYHPEYNALMRRDDKLMAAYTAADGREWMRRADAYARQRKLNVIVQDTAQNPEFSAAMMKSYRRDGYRVEAVMMAVPKVVSDQGITYRYYEQVRDRGQGRLTVQEKADLSYRSIPELARRIDEQHLVDRIRLFRRGQTEPCYENALAAPDRWRDESALAATLVSGREQRPWTRLEAEGFESTQLAMKGERDPSVLAKLGPDWPSRLADLDRRAEPKISQAIGQTSAEGGAAEEAANSTQHGRSPPGRRSSGLRQPGQHETSIPRDQPTTEEPPAGSNRHSARSEPQRRESEETVDNETRRQSQLEPTRDTDQSEHAQRGHGPVPSDKHDPPEARRTREAADKLREEIQQRREAQEWREAPQRRRDPPEHGPNQRPEPER